jgi:hypothetical protein
VICGIKANFTLTPWDIAYIDRSAATVHLSPQTAV